MTPLSVIPYKTPEDVLSGEDASGEDEGRDRLEVPEVPGAANGDGVIDTLLPAAKEIAVETTDDLLVEAAPAKENLLGAGLRSPSMSSSKSSSS